MCTNHKNRFTKIIAIVLSVIVAVLAIGISLFFAFRYTNYKKGIYFQKLYGYYSFREGEDIQISYRCFNVKNAISNFENGEIYIISDNEEYKAEIVDSKIIQVNNLYKLSELKINILLEENTQISAQKLKVVFNGTENTYDIGGLIFEKFPINSSGGNTISITNTLTMFEPKYNISIKNITHEEMHFLGVNIGDKNYYGSKILAPDEETEIEINLEHLLKDKYVSIILKISGEYEINGQRKTFTNSMPTEYNNLIGRESILSFLRESSI